VAAFLDSDLARRATAGDRAALHVIWHGSRRWLCGVLLAHAPHGSDLEDRLRLDSGAWGCWSGEHACPRAPPFPPFVPLTRRRAATTLRFATMTRTMTTDEQLTRLLGEPVVGQRQALAQRWASAKPFRHVVIDGFLADEVYRGLSGEFPAFSERNARNEYGEVGGKSVRERVRSLGPTYREVDDLLRSEAFLAWMGEVTGIGELLYDPLYIGGGTHENRSGQELDPHIDFNYHPKYGWHRRLNLIVFLNERWERQWGGNLQLHSDPWGLGEDHVVTVEPVRNRGVVFETTEWSWHGFPRICLPDGGDVATRRSFAVYLYSRERPAEEARAPHSTVYGPPPLPASLRAGSTLGEADVAELRTLIDSRTRLLRWLYDREVQMSATIESLRRQLERRNPLRRAARAALGAVRPLVYRLHRRFKQD
jgi:Rps23 Pro-64 3,4-dihydroxylase Tpa1-like proline 4-hydroxylase